MHLGSLESTQEARVALGSPRATLTLLSCSPNFPRASITRYTHAKNERILNWFLFDFICNYALNHKNYNFLDCDWFKKVLFSTNSLGKLLSDSLLLDSLLLDSLLSDSSISQSHSKLQLRATCARACFCVFASSLFTPPFSVF